MTRDDIGGSNSQGGQMTRFFHRIFGWLWPEDILPPPDRSVHRGAYLADRQQQYIRQLDRQL